MAAVSPCWKHACSCVYIQYVMSYYLIVIILSVYLLFSCGFTDWQSQTHRWIKRVEHNQKCLWRGLLFSFFNNEEMQCYFEQKWEFIIFLKETKWLLFNLLKTENLCLNTHPFTPICRLEKMSSHQWGMRKVSVTQRELPLWQQNIGSVSLFNRNKIGIICFKAV